MTQITVQAKIARFQAGYMVLPPEKQAEIRGMAEAFGVAQKEEAGEGKIQQAACTGSRLSIFKGECDEKD